jgi:hypothetical protein
MKSLKSTTQIKRRIEWYSTLGEMGIKEWYSTLGGEGDN